MFTSFRNFPRNKSKSVFTHLFVFRSMNTNNVTDTLRQKTISENLEDVRGRIRAIKEARLVAVSKYKPVTDIIYAYEAGQRHFGENYVQELVEKATELPNDIQWHFIGHLQSNKCKTLAAIPNLWAVETIDSKKKADTLNKACAAREDPLRVFIQVNTSNEESKGGIKPDESIDVARHIIENCPKLELTGLMTIGAADHDPANGPNPDFKCLADCKNSVEQTLKIELELSMGMSDDFEHALEMGSTNVRVGSTIFGARPQKRAD
ncbi:uncharacterized protein VTP21DRAFT_8683 [Calcarisporiella thermophila]|uniref:uncharacterized protein n=1 Tax=Calcarisporiella thermophila TaxID=911321 RepID=UPI0037438F09